MPWLTLALAGLGAVSEQKKQDQQREQRANDTRFSPWTGIAPGQITSGGALSGGIQGAATGLSLSQSMENSAAIRDHLGKEGAGSMTNTLPVLLKSGSEQIGPVASGSQYGAMMPNYSSYASMPNANGPQQIGPWAQGNKYSGWGR